MKEEERSRRFEKRTVMLYSPSHFSGNGVVSQVINDVAVSRHQGLLWVF